MKKRIGATILLLIAAITINAQETDFPKLTGPYLGQKPPGKKPESFAANIPELHSLHAMIRFSPDGKEAYWKPADWSVPILVSRIENGQWTKPKAAPFSSGSQGDDAPFFSPDGRKLFFLSARPYVRGTQEKDRIWVMERTSEGWSEPKLLPDVINSMEGFHYHFSVDNQGNLYFGVHRKGVEGDIYCAKYKDGQYSRPEKNGA